MIEMSTDAIGGASAATSAASGMTKLDGDAFLKLLVAQLRYQNPMEPSDGTQMLQQTAQFTMVATLEALSASQQRLLGFQQASVATNLMGQQVEALDLTGSVVSGEVTGVRFTADGPMLTIGESEVPLEGVTTIGSS